jgi:hypothetical protein
VVVNTGDRLAARKALMQSFRSHLELFRTGGKHCSSCCDKDVADSDPVNINDMMKSKFRLTWRHSMLAWICFMGLLLLAFIYADNTDWGDSWYRVPTKYNITDLLNADDDEIAALAPKPKGKAVKNNVKEDNVDATEVEVAQKKGKTGKKNIEDPVQVNHEKEENKAGKKM